MAYTRPLAIQIKYLWGRVSLPTRIGILWVAALGVVRRVLWSFTTPASRADAPRALAMIDVYLVLCYLELVGCVLLCVALLLEFRHQAFLRRNEEGLEPQAIAPESPDNTWPNGHSQPR